MSIANVDKELKTDKKRNPRKTSKNIVRFITIGGHKYRFDYEWGTLEESIAKQAYLDKENNTIIVILNDHYHILNIIPKPDIFYHIVYLTEGIVEVFLRENNISMDKLIYLRDKFTQQIADNMSEDIIEQKNQKESMFLGAQTYLLKKTEQDKIPLNKNEKFVLEQKLENGLSPKEIANELKLSRQRVDQIFNSALNKINSINKPKTSKQTEKSHKLTKLTRLEKLESLKENINSIIQNTAKMYNISVKDLIGKRRQAGLVLPRHTVMYLLRKELNLSFLEIARIMHKKDHSTIMYAYNKMYDSIRKSKLSAPRS